MKRPSRVVLRLTALFVAALTIAWFSSLQFRVWVRAIAGRPSPVWNWCPQNVSRVQAVDGRWSESRIDELRVLCAARIDEPVENARNGPFTAVMRAENPSGQLTFVERDGDLFRVDGHVFRSHQFETILRKRTTSP